MASYFFSISSSGCHLDQWSGTVVATLVQGHDRTYFEIDPSAREELPSKFFSCPSCFSSGGHFVHWSGTF